VVDNQELFDVIGQSRLVIPDSDFLVSNPAEIPDQFPVPVTSSERPKRADEVISKPIGKVPFLNC
jgi:hypothetical protein